MKNIIFYFLLLWASVVSAQSSDDSLWHLKPFNQVAFAGIDYNKALELTKDREPQEIIVAVIDNGVDIYHPDLQGRIWVNEDEIPGNGIDDDNNGYIDDIHGWNFLGNADTSVTYDNMEITRQYVLLREKYRNVDESAVAKDPDFIRYQKIKVEFDALYNSAKSNLTFYRDVVSGIKKIEKKLGKIISLEELSEYKPRSESQFFGWFFLRMDAIVEGEADTERVLKEIGETVEYYEYLMDYGYNTRFDPRQELVGDNYDDPYEKIYGNNQVYISEKFSSHGTHVAGIIAAIRDNEIGGHGICQTARIMVLRCVPEGDERDKDVANSIIYAVDNGAKIINMSFGKSYAHNSEVVKKAIAYAREHGVLLIHAAGNDSKNNDLNDNFPNDFNEYSDVWIEVGASSWQTKPDMLAEFSNYGHTQVDLFAPGVNIYSTVPDSAYDAFDGTSMASPVVAGVAAFLWSYYPELTAQEIKQILMESTMPLKKSQKIPGEKRKKKKLKKLCVSGGIINLARAMELAAMKAAGPSGS
jgi:subtilisin family serine protease